MVLALRLVRVATAQRSKVISESRGVNRAADKFVHTSMDFRYTGDSTDYTRHWRMAGPLRASVRVWLRETTSAMVESWSSRTAPELDSLPI